MRTVIIDPPPHFLEERRRLGQDVRDEMWDGVVHVVPSPSAWHQYFAHRLGHVLLPLADAKGLLATHETMLERPGTDRDWRVPDLLYAPFEHAAVGCGEVVVIDRDTCAVELFSLDETGKYVRTTGPVELASLGATVTTIEGPGVRVTWEGGSADVLV